MKLTLKQFGSLLEENGIRVGESVLNDLFNGLKKLLGEDKGQVNQFIQAYCDVFYDRWGTNPVVTGKLAGIAKRIVKDVGLPKAISLIQQYLLMDDYIFVVRRHDLVTFEQNLQVIGVKLDTGQSVTQTQARRGEQKASNTDVMRRFVERRRNGPA
jgi:hypothetical protein